MQVQERVAEGRPLDLRFLPQVVGEPVIGVPVSGSVSVAVAVTLPLGALVLARVDLDVRDAAVPVLRARPVAAAGLLSLQLGLYAQVLHFVHLADGLLQVLRELAPVVLVPRVERDQHLVAHALGQPNAVGVICNEIVNPESKSESENRRLRSLTGHLEQRDDHATEREAVPEGVRDGRLLLAQDLRDDQQVVEEKDLSLVHAGPLLLVDVGYLVEAAVADQAAVRQRHVRLLAHDRGLHLHNLRHVVGARLELVRLHALVDAGQHVAVDVPAVVDAPQVLDEVLQPHPALRLDVRRVQVRVEHDYRESQHEHLLVTDCVKVRSQKKDRKAYSPCLEIAAGPRCRCCTGSSAARRPP